jgi:curli biogenesis system outer membrane secretion channel CsgG
VIVAVCFGFCALAVAAPKIAVVDFDTNQYSAQLAGAQLADYVVDELVNTGLFEVVEREKLASVTREIGLSQSGMVDPAGASQMGRLLGARYVLTGRVISMSAEEKAFSGYGINTTNTILTLSVSVRVVNGETGSIEFSGRTSAQRTINQAGGLSVRSSNAYGGLAEDAAVKVVAEIVKSGRFNAASTGGAAPIRAKLVRVAVESSPPGADVEVDGIFYGNAGETLRLPEGLHLVKISLGGRRAWEKKVQISDGFKLKAVLPPQQN